MSDRLLDVASELLEGALRSGADQAEVAIAEVHSADTRIENGRVHTAQTTDETAFGLRLFAGGSLGFATANSTDPRTVADCIAEALAQTRATPSDPCNGLPPAEPITPVADLFDPTAAAMTVGDTTTLARRMLERVRRRDGRIRVDSGAVSATRSGVALASSEGVRAFEETTTVRGYLFGMAVDGDEVASFDYDGDASPSAREIPNLLDAAADRFVDKCLAGLGAVPGKSFRGSVVLSPEAVGEFLIADLIAAVSADNVRKGRSRLAGKLGEPIAAPLLTIVDDGTIPGIAGSSAFDREGVPTRRYPIVAAGVLRGFLFNHYEAVASGAGTASSGHASGGVSSLPAIGPHRIEVAAGDTPMEDLCANDGGPVVYVGRFSGSTNPVTGEFSGVVKNGFLYENGSRRPINETLIAGDLFDCLMHVSAVSRERRRIDGSDLLPAMRIDGVSVTTG